MIHNDSDDYEEFCAWALECCGCSVPDMYDEHRFGEIIQLAIRFYEEKDAEEKA